MKQQNQRDLVAGSLDDQLTARLLHQRIIAVPARRTGAALMSS